ncbi:MAG: SHOCT domain-containing protein [Candidatus Eisenbacteria bacterium]
MKVVIILIVMLLTVSVAALGDAGNSGHMGYGDRMMSYGGGLLMWLIILIVAAIVVYAAFQLTRSRGQAGTTGETPLDILKKRYARGEITLEEFEEKKRHLMT